MFVVCLSSLTLTRCLCSLKCEKGLLLLATEIEIEKMTHYSRFESDQKTVFLTATCMGGLILSIWPPAPAVYIYQLSDLSMSLIHVPASLKL